MIFMSCANGEKSEGKRDFALEREKMVREQLMRRDITHPGVLEAMSQVPRHLFVPEKYISSAYSDHPLPIGYDQTISQPYIVALMTQAAAPEKEDVVLEIGTGSGYQAAVLSMLCRKVYSIEIVPELAQSAAECLKKTGYDNIEVKTGDGYIGWEEYAPFDCILITAAPPKVPQALLDQLKIGGRLVVPEGSYFQELRLYTKDEEGIKRKDLIPVRFVPMIHGEEK
ncbi:protein-L-isoaspartate(D-aspartate) O-methyltransferase [bacterium]|nr:protein-L-isoaspartate(D-aspartate) O-methyltransferase [bacterium]